MPFKCTINDLKSARALIISIQITERKIADLRAIKGTWNITGMSSHSLYKKYSSVEDVILEIDKLENELIHKIKKYNKSLNKAKKAISTLEPPVYDVMMLRYLCGYSWAKIAKELNYSERHVYRLNKRGLKDVS